MSTEERGSHRVVGQSVPRVDGVDKVTGSGAFVADLRAPGALEIKLVRSPLAHGLIKNIDATAALALAGVRAVVTGADGKDMLQGDCIKDHPPLARGKVRFHGEPLAAVVATSADEALAGASLIKVDLDPLPPVLTIDDALAPGAPLIHDDPAAYDHLPTFRPQSRSNIYHHYHLIKGDVDQALAKAEHIVESTFTFPHQAHGQLEPHGCLARWDKDGSLTVWSSSQAPHLVKAMLAELFHIPQTRVRVIVPYLGGGFGGKSDYSLEPLVALVARQVVGRTVRLILEREEVFHTVLGRGGQVHIRTGANRDGKIVAQDIRFYVAGGAYGNNSINIVEGGGHNVTGPYEVADLRVEAYGVYVNKPPVGAYRGYGHPEGHWAVERQMDILAQRLNLDPLELRLRNIYRPGSTSAFGQRIEDHHGNLELCLREAARLIGLDEPCEAPRPGKARGKGIAALAKSPVMATGAASTAMVRLNSDGTVNLAVSGIDMGQGSITVLSQIAAEALELPLDAVSLARTTDSAFSPYEWQTVGSTTTWKVGNALVDGAQRAIVGLRSNAALAWGVTLKEVGYGKGECYLHSDPAQRLPIERLALGYLLPDGRVVGRPVVVMGAYVPPDLTFADPHTGQGHLAAEWTFGCQAAEVEVDLATGVITALHLATALDAGRVIHPDLARGQVVGAMVQAMGGALTEEVVYSDKGVIRNSNYVDYRMPGPEDMPARLSVTFLTTPPHDAPYGARPIAEHGVVAVAPAIANAVRNAVGLHFTDLPLSPDRVLRALREAERAGQPATEGV